MPNCSKLDRSWTGQTGVSFDVEFLVLALRPMSGFAQNRLAHEPSYGCGSKSLQYQSNFRNKMSSPIQSCPELLWHREIKSRRWFTGKLTYRGNGHDIKRLSTLK